MSRLILGLASAYWRISSLNPVSMALLSVGSNSCGGCSFTATSATSIPSACVTPSSVPFFTPSTRTRTTLFGSFMSCLIFTSVPTWYKSSYSGSETSGSTCVARKIFWSFSIAFSTAWIDFFLLISKCMTMSGNTVIPLNAINGKFIFFISI